MKLHTPRSWRAPAGDQPASGSTHHQREASTPSAQPMAPGDEAPPGTPGTGEDVCPDCGGSGKLGDGKACGTCDGSGVVTVGIGGA